MTPTQMVSKSSNLTRLRNHNHDKVLINLEMQMLLLYKFAYKEALIYLYVSQVDPKLLETITYHRIPLRKCKYVIYDESSTNSNGQSERN